MTQEYNNVLSDIKRQLNIILLNSTFADKVNPYAKISTMITFPEDINIIKSHIKRIFKFDVTQDIANMTPQDLIDLIYTQNSNFKLPNNQYVFTQNIANNKKSATANTGIKWSRDLIYAHIIKNISNVMGRNVQSTEKISDLMYEASMSGNDLDNLNSKLQELEIFFSIKIDQSMKIYNVGNVAETSFIAQGIAPERNKNPEKDPLWAAIMTVMSKSYLKSVLQHDFDINVSTRVLADLKSYEELKALVQEKRQQKHM